MTTTVTGTNAASQTTSGSNTSTSKTTTSAAIEDRFLKLLVTQLQNQDPLNPMDSSQTTSQMAQISTVTGIEKLNTAMTNMATALASNQSYQAATLVGHSVLADGKGLTLANGSASAGIELAGDADDVTVSVKDASGNVVQKVSLGAQKAGLVTFSWDGKTDAGGTAADGNYTFSVAATQGGKSVDSNTLSYGKVGSVTFDASGIKLQVSGLGSVSMADIRQIV